MLVNRPIAALYNGVSQQPPTLRLPSQAEENINVYSSVVDGARKRPPTEHLATLDIDVGASYHLHTINRDSSHRYIVVITNGDLKVYNLAGEEQTVSFPHGKDYLLAAEPKTDIHCMTVADYTFILNRTTVVQMSEEGADIDNQPSNYWWLNRSASYAIASEFLSGLVAQQIQYSANLGYTTNKGTKQSFQDLPETSSNGDLYEITGTDETKFTTYYVVRDGAVWNETVKPGLRNLLDATTMPHALVRKSDGTFEFGPFSFAPRRVGDENTNKNPSFIGRTINDLFFYKNRLGFATDENVVLSRAGDFGNFYRLTVLDALADEVIDIAASETKVTLINHAVPFDTSMMLFSEQVQFRLNHGDVLKAGSCSLDPATEYTCLPDVRPVALGSNVYFPAEAEGWAIIREYYVRDNSESTDAGNITAHVPRYIPAGVKGLAGSSTHDVLFVYTSGAPNSLFVYKFYWTEDNTKIQSAWSRWEFAANATIQSAEVLGDSLYLVIHYAGPDDDDTIDDVVTLERMALQSGAKAPGLGYQIYLDRRAALTGTYLPTTNVTEFSLPYVANQDTYRVVRGAAHTTPGSLVDMTGWTWVDGSTLQIPGDLSAGPCLLGENYVERFEFSQVFYANAQGVPVVSGRLQLRTYTMYFLDAAYFKTEVSPYGISPDIEEVIPSKIAEFDGKTLGQVDLTLGSPVFSAGSYTFTVWGDSTAAKLAVVNDTPYSLTLQQAEWEGFYFNRAKTL
jgi:hypothetical protein